MEQFFTTIEHHSETAIAIVLFIFWIIIAIKTRN
jgi:hypothetical protein